jgi:hypothetical protein
VRDIEIYLHARLFAHRVNTGQEDRDSQQGSDMLMHIQARRARGAGEERFW